MRNMFTVDAWIALQPARNATQKFMDIFLFLLELSVTRSTDRGSRILFPFRLISMSIEIRPGLSPLAQPDALPQLGWSARHPPTNVSFSATLRGADPSAACAPAWLRSFMPLRKSAGRVASMTRTAPEGPATSLLSFGEFPIERRRMALQDDARHLAHARSLVDQAPPECDLLCRQC